MIPCTTCTTGYHDSMYIGYHGPMRCCSPPTHPPQGLGLVSGLRSSSSGFGNTCLFQAHVKQAGRQGPLPAGEGLRDWVGPSTFLPSLPEASRPSALQAPPSFLPSALIMSSHHLHCEKQAGGGACMHEQVEVHACMSIAGRAS